MRKHVFITGASSGIGWATTKALLAAGYEVWATVRTSDDEARLRETMTGALHVVQLDVRDAASIHAAKRRVEMETNALHALINNAGIVATGPMEAVPAASLRNVFQVNVEGVLAVSQAFLPLLRERQGRLVQVSSVGARNTLPFAGAYCASKHALTAISDAMRMELRPWGIKVILVEPGSVATPIWTKGATRAPYLETPEVNALYREAMLAMQSKVASVAKRGIPAERVAEFIVAAISAKRPRTRYVVGPMAHVRLLLQKLPDRLRDAILLRQLTR